MAENPIAGALSNLGRTFRDLSTQRLEQQRLELLGRREEAGQVRALEALRLQGQTQIAEQELALVREQAAERQLNREFGLKERETSSLETYRQGQLDVARQEAAGRRAFEQGQLALQQRREAREERAFELNEPTRRLNEQILQNQLTQSNLSLDEQQQKTQLWKTEFPLATLRDMFLSQGVPQANVDAATLGIETMKRALAGPDAEVSDKITYGDAVTYGAFVTQAMKLVQTGKDRDVLEMAYKLVNDVAGEEASPEERLQIAQELYLTLKDPQGTEQRFRQADFNRQVNRAIVEKAAEAGVDLKKLTPEQTAALRARVEDAVRQRYQETGRPVPQGVQTLAPQGQAQGEDQWATNARRTYLSLPVETRTRLDQLVAAAAQRHGVSPAELYGLMGAESHFDPQARSRAGAIGLMQLMPDTAKQLGVDPYSLEGNIEGGAAYYAQLKRRYGGDRAKALAAYNAGPGAVDRYGGIPPYKETRQHGARAELLRQQFAAQEGPTAPQPAPAAEIAPPRAPQEGLVTFTPGRSARGTQLPGQAPPRVLLPTTSGQTGRGTVRTEPPAAVSAVPPERQGLGVPAPALQPTPPAGFPAQAEAAAPPAGVLAPVTAAVPAGLPSLAPEQIQHFEVFLQQGGDPAAVIQALVAAGMAPEAAQLAVTSGQLPALRRVLAEEAATRLQFRPAPPAQPVLRSVVPQ